MPNDLGNSRVSPRGPGVFYGAEVRAAFTGQPPRGDAEA